MHKIVVLLLLFLMSSSFASAQDGLFRRKTPAPIHSAFPVMPESEESIAPEDDSDVIDLSEPRDPIWVRNHVLSALMRLPAGRLRSTSLAKPPLFLHEVSESVWLYEADTGTEVCKIRVPSPKALDEAVARETQRIQQENAELDRQIQNEQEELAAAQLASKNCEKARREEQELAAERRRTMGAAFQLQSKEASFSMEQCLEDHRGLQRAVRASAPGLLGYPGPSGMMGGLEAVRDERNFGPDGMPIARATTCRRKANSTRTAGGTEQPRVVGSVEAEAGSADSAF